MSQKGDFENPKVPNYDFSTKSVPDKFCFSNSAVYWGPRKLLLGRVVVNACGVLHTCSSTHKSAFEHRCERALLHTT